MTEFITIAAILPSRINFIPYEFIMVTPNPLGITDIEDCPYYKDFADFDGRADTINLQKEIKYLQGVINDYVKNNMLYCDIKQTKPMIYIIM